MRTFKRSGYWELDHARSLLRQAIKSGDKPAQRKLKSRITMLVKELDDENSRYSG